MKGFYIRSIFPPLSSNRMIESRGDRPNEYLPTSCLHSRYASMPKHPADLQTKTGTRHLSTWICNGIALLTSTIVNCIVFLCMALSGSEDAQEILIGVIAVSFVCASWANLGLGPKIGWDRGGLPVVLIVVSAATVFYSLVAVMAGVCLCICIGFGISIL